MPFKMIMKKLVEDTQGAMGAIFVDWEGEAVDQFSLDNESYNLKLVGAHKGVILSLINNTQRQLLDNEALQVIIKMEKYNVIIAPVKDGYFVVLKLKPEALLSKAHHGLKSAVAALKKEM